MVAEDSEMGAARQGWGWPPHRGLGRWANGIGMTPRPTGSGRGGLAVWGAWLGALKLGRE
jgi:hypothetical protein